VVTVEGPISPVREVTADKVGASDQIADGRLRTLH